MDELDFGYIFVLSAERAEVRSKSVFVMSTNGECLVFFSALQTNSLYKPCMQGQKVVRGALVCVITGFKVNNWIVVNHGVVVAVNMR